MTMSMENAPIAFAAVVGAGLSTVLGAAVVFTPGLHKYASRKVLAISLSFASGVMIYVSFVEIFRKSVASFAKAGLTDQVGRAITTVCFFAGIVAIWVRFPMDWHCARLFFNGTT